MSTAVHEGESADARVSTVNTKSQGYFALVWRRFRRSVSGMFGLILVILLLLTSIFAEFVAPEDPNGPTIAFAPPDQVSFITKQGFTLWPVSFKIVESDQLDPVTSAALLINHVTDGLKLARQYRLPARLRDTASACRRCCRHRDPERQAHWRGLPPRPAP